MNAAAREVIAALQLEPLPGEGGFFRQTWRSAGASGILFLLTPEDFSALHRLEMDELWHFHSGDCVEHVQLDPPGGGIRVTRLGANVIAGEAPQVLVPAGVWQGARLAAGGPSPHGFALVGCTVSPPWDERRFQLGTRDTLIAAHPRGAALIRALTR